MTNMLDTNNYVRCLMIDFSKAFDTVEHIVLVKKLHLLGVSDMPDPLDGIAQKRAAKLLDVIFTGKLSFEDHVDFVMTVCSQCVYLLKLSRSQGLPIQQLQLWSLWP